VAEREVREAAAASTEQSCPRCGVPREPQQEYCLECGLRLPPMTGVVADLRRGWIRRFGWYPGDWIWTALLTLLVAIAGIVVAIALTSGGGTKVITFVATTPHTPTVSATTTPVQTHPQTTTHAVTTTPAQTTTVARATTTIPTRTTPASKPVASKPAKAAPKPRVPTPAAANGQIAWPSGRSGWTDVLASYPSSGGRAAADTVAARAAGGGLRQVGVLDSSAYASLHAGYYVVFSGVYPSQAAAEAALAQARSRGFGSAYARQISG